MTAALFTSLSSPFENWCAREYLRDYYSRVEIDEEITLQFVLREAGKIAPGTTALEFGAGPTAHYLIALSAYVSVIDAADFLQPNLKEIRKWMLDDPDAHDWRPFIRHILACEGNKRPDEEAIRLREALARRRIWNLLACDASMTRPLSAGGRGQYDVLLTCFCADSATSSKAEWRRFMRNTLSLLKPGGLLIMTALRKCRWYRVGANWYPSANLEEHDLQSMLRISGFERSETSIEAREVPGQEDRGYDSIFLVSGRKTLKDQDQDWRTPSTHQEAYPQ
jgi:NNMT/PNMT/TEMT family